MSNSRSKTLNEIWKTTSKLVDLLTIHELLEESRRERASTRNKLCLLERTIDTVVTGIERRWLEEMETYRVLQIFWDIEWVYHQVKKKKGDERYCRSLIDARAYAKRYPPGGLFSNGPFPTDELTAGQKKRLSLGYDDIRPLGGPVTAAAETVGSLLNIRGRQMINVVKRRERKATRFHFRELSETLLDHLRKPVKGSGFKEF